MCNAHALAQNPAAPFESRLITTLNSAATALMISIGHRTRLFDVMDNLAPSTSEEIAEKARLNERYVREWLGAMTCAGIIEVDSSGQRFQLPEEHAESLTRRAEAGNLAPYTQYVSTLGYVESKIVRSFNHGGGVGYDDFERFHEVMAEDSGQTVLSSLFDVILPLVPGLEGRLAEGISVLDVGCGKGLAILALAKAFPKSRFVGIDLCEPPLAEARALATQQRLSNVLFIAQDAELLSDRQKFDFITTFDAVHDQARPDKVLASIYQALRHGGTYLMQDIDASTNVANNLDHPLGPFLYTISTMHCMSVSLARGGMGLGTMWGRERARLLLREAGFADWTEHKLPHDPQNRYFVLQK